MPYWSLSFVAVCLVLLYGEVISFRVGVIPSRRISTKLHVIPKRNDKVRVRLLQDVKRIGLKDDILLVSKEQWMNILQPKRSCVIVKDSEVELIEQATLVAEARKDAELNEFIKNISELPILEIVEKATSGNFKLYGSVTSKVMIDQVKKNLDAKLAARMTVKTLVITDILHFREGLNQYQTVNFQKSGEVRFAGLYKIILKLKGHEEALSVQLRIIPEIDPNL